MAHVNRKSGDKGNNISPPQTFVCLGMTEYGTNEIDHQSTIAAYSTLKPKLHLPNGLSNSFVTQDIVDSFELTFLFYKDHLKRMMLYWGVALVEGYVD